MTEYTLEQCLEQQKKVDAGIKHNGEYNPLRAARAETIELQEHLGLIKTWGENKVDIKQAFMELVDIQAFTMSALLIKYSIEDILENIHFREVNFGSYEFECIEKETDSLSTLFSDLCVYRELNKIKLICEEYFKRPVTDIYYYYMGKQTLTRFRQDNGYKDGTYIKKWGEREDNEFLTDALEQGIEIDAVYEHLKTNYERIVIAKAEVE